MKIVMPNQNMQYFCLRYTMTGQAHWRTKGCSLLRETWSPCQRMSPSSCSTWHVGIFILTALVTSHLTTQSSYCVVFRPVLCTCWGGYCPFVQKPKEHVQVPWVYFWRWFLNIKDNELYSAIYSFKKYLKTHFCNPLSSYLVNKPCQPSPGN